MELEVRFPTGIPPRTPPSPLSDNRKKFPFKGYAALGKKDSLEQFNHLLKTNSDGRKLPALKLNEVSTPSAK